MGIEENKALIFKLYEEYNKGNYDFFDECVTDDFVAVSNIGTKRDIANYKRFLLTMRDSFPDTQRKIEDVIVTDDRAALFFTWTGTWTGEVMGVPPTGKKDTVREIYFMRFKNGKISEYRQYGDSYGMMFNFGVLVDTRPLEENKKIVKEFTERFGSGDSSVVDELTTDDYVAHVLSGTGYDVADKNVMKQTNDGGHVGFPDYSMTVNDIIAEGDKVYVLSTKTGTHKGDFLGIPATGNQISVFRFALYRLEDGKIAESWIGEDAAQFQQIGVLPTIAEAIQAYKESHNLD